MSDWTDSERIAAAVHALTGRWIDGEALSQIVARGVPRDEMLAAGIVDHGWLEACPPALAAFADLASSALSAAPTGEDRSVPAPRPAGGLTRDVAMELVARHQQNPGEVHPFEALRRLAVCWKAAYLRREDRTR